MTLVYLYPQKTRDQVIAALESSRAALRYASQRAYDDRDYRAGIRFDTDLRIIDVALESVDAAERAQVSA
jgi:hypothetical protein